MPFVARIGIALSATAWTGIGFILFGTAGYYGPFILWLSVLCVAAGVSLLVLFALNRFNWRSTQVLSFAPSQSARQYFRWAQQLPLKGRFSGIASFGLVAAILYFLVAIPFMILQPPTSIGLTVHLLKPGALMMNGDFGTDPIVVRIAVRRSSVIPDLYVQSKLVSSSTLAEALKDELKLRPTKIVYVLGDPELTWADVVRAIDIIRGVPAEVVLLTADSIPRTPSRKH